MSRFINKFLIASLLTFILNVGQATFAAELPSELTIPASKPTQTNDLAIAKQTVRVEGQIVEVEIHPTEELLRYAPIFEALKIRHAYDPAMKTLRARRPYDNATLELVFPRRIGACKWSNNRPFAKR